jgi:hypothetical protein
MSNSDGLCAECTSDKYLVDKIQTTGSRLACVGCGQKGRKCIPIKELAADVREVLEKHFHRCESIEEGDSLNWVVQEIASVEPEIADRILEDALPSKGERIAAVKDGEDLFLEDGATYVERPAFDQEFRYHWESFCFNVKHSARFFSTTAESRLRELLEGIERFKTPDGKPCIRQIAPGEPEAKLHRARLALDSPTIVKILDNPAAEVSAPPGRSATAGRMNPSGISVFYGSFDAKTCLAEIRPPVGGGAFAAEFRLVRPITVLDLTVLDQGIHGVSMLDPSYDHVSEQSAFLAGFHDEISRPVLKQEEELEFIPTQVVAEYLAHKFNPPLDGVIYKSAQTGGQKLNIALFHHASGLKGVEVATPRKLEPEVHFDDEAGEVVIVDPRPAKKGEDLIVEQHAMEALSAYLEIEMSDAASEPDVAVAPTLEFVDGSLTFWKVKSVEQDVESRRVVDMRKKEDNEDDADDQSTGPSAF